MNIFLKVVISFLFLAGISMNTFANSDDENSKWLEVDVNKPSIQVRGDGRELGLKLKLPLRSLLDGREIRIENNSADCIIYDTFIEPGENEKLLKIFYIHTAVVADTGGCDILVLEYSFDYSREDDALISKIKYRYNTDY